MKPITARQKATLDFIKKFIADNGYSPTVREIGAGIFIASHSTICVLLHHLMEKGYIERAVGRSRSIIVLDQLGTVCKCDSEIQDLKEAVLFWQNISVMAQNSIYEKDALIKSLEMQLEYTINESKSFCASRRDVPR